MSTSKPVTGIIARQQAEALAHLPFENAQDFEDARRGLVAEIKAPVVAEDGTVLWDNSTYAFVQGEAPDSVHPSLWRQSTLVAMGGLFEVVEGIYQVRGMDLSNTTFVEGDEGIVVIDTLLSVETGAAALALYREHPRRPSGEGRGLHAHARRSLRWGPGIRLAGTGRLRRGADPRARGLHRARGVGERVRGDGDEPPAGYMYGAALARGPQGQVGTGLGQTLSIGTVSLMAPTDLITETGHEETIDGVRMVFQMAPDTEAPSEMLLYLPDFKALCAAEDATHNLHNLLTLRGAVVRDPHAWARYLTETIDLFGREADVVFASHHWPTWGSERVTEFLTLQRDLYAYLHDQTLRLLNKGLVGAEIAEAIVMPPALERAWSTRGYYGSVSHNVKAIYQRYLGWYDGNPAHLWQHTPVERATREVEFMGGADAVVEKARASFDSGDFRWVADVLNDVVFVEPQHTAARELLADAYEQLGYGSENGTWRSFYLSGATELRDGQFGTPTETNAPDVIAQLSPAMLFDAIAIQVDGPKAWDLDLSIDVVLTDVDERYRLRLSNGALTYSPRPQQGAAQATVTTTRRALPALAGGAMSADGLAAAGIEVSGDATVLAQLTGVLDPGDKNFAIVTP